mgnify:CR=1 FL=1
MYGRALNNLRSRRRSSSAFQHQDSLFRQLQASRHSKVAARGSCLSKDLSEPSAPAPERAASVVRAARSARAAAVTLIAMVARSGRHCWMLTTPSGRAGRSRYGRRRLKMRRKRSTQIKHPSGPARRRRRPGTLILMPTPPIAKARCSRCYTPRRRAAHELVFSCTP